MECLICKKTLQKNKKSFLINLPYRAGTVKEDIIEFLGESVREYLHDDQTVCSICLYMLEEIVASKHEMLMAIKHSEKKYTPKIGNLWTIFQRKFSEDNDLTPNLLTSTPPQATIPRDSTPVMYLSKTKPYNQIQEKYFELRENMKREIRDTDLTSEWSCKTEGRPYNRKDMKAFHSKRAKIQRMRKELEGTEVLSPQRPLSSASSMLSFFGNDDKKRGRKKRRQTKEDVEEVEEDEEDEEELDLKCWNRLCDCESFGNNVALYTNHRIEKHQEEPYYTCLFCEFKYFTQKHLDIHLKKHQFPPALCGICGTMQKNMDSYQKHVEKHFKQSYECFLCRLSFLTKKECNSHVFNKHRYRRLFLDRRKQTERKKYGIVDQRIYENKHDSSEPVSDTTANKTYTTVIMDNIYNRKEESFKPMSFKEMYLSQKLLTSEPPTKASTPQPLSLREDMLCKGSGTNTFQVELGQEPNVDTSIRNYNKFVQSLVERMEPRSGRSSAMRRYSNYTYDRSNIPSDDEAYSAESDITGWSSYQSSRRDLESRASDLCSEVAHYLDRQSPSQSTSKGASPVYEEEQSDIETEYPPLY